MEKIKNWLIKNRFEAAILTLILALGAFLRLYKIGAYMTFLGDEGRDAILVWRLLTKGDIILIGPGTSIGNMYLGPLYYYFIAPALFAALYNPVGPSVLVALTGVATIFLVWLTAKEWFGNLAAIVSSSLYAISPTVIIYSRSSWNPNIMPFFSLVLIYSIWKIWKKQEYRWLLVLGLAFAFVLQSHYLGLLLAPIILIFWSLAFLNLFRNSKSEIRNYVKSSILGLGVFLTLMSPLVIFDARHGWMNFNSMKTFFTVRQETVSIRPWNALPRLWPNFVKVNTRLIAGREKKAGTIVSVLLAISLGSMLLKRLGERKQAFTLLLSWLGFALLGLGLYKQEIYDHYYGFFFTAPFLILGGLTWLLGRESKTKSVILGAGAVALLGVNLYQSPLKYPPTYQMRRAVEVAKKIEKEAGRKPFNLAVIAERNYEDGYEYFLLKDGAKVVDIDPNNTSATITDQLFVVCEKPREKCDPTHNEKAEIAYWGWSGIEKEEEVMGVTLFKLVHTEN